MTPVDFDNALATKLVIAWQVADSADQPAIMAEFLTYAFPLIHWLCLRSGCLGATHELGDLIGECVLKIHKIIPRFDPKRGNLYSLMVFSLSNQLRTLAEHQRYRSCEISTEAWTLEAIFNRHHQGVVSRPEVRIPE